MVSGQASSQTVVDEILRPMSEHLRNDGENQAKPRGLDGSEDMVDVCRTWIRHGACLTGDACEFAHGIELQSERRGTGRGGATAARSAEAAALNPTDLAQF